MKLGTKSVLVGAHQFLIHPIFVFLAWWKLYGFPWDPRLWVAFFIHDLGYIGLPNMDGEEGTHHPERMAVVMTYLFDRWPWSKNDNWVILNNRPKRVALGKWGQFILFHSRFYSKKYGLDHNRLCVADKLAFVLEPWWLYLPRVMLSGEIHEYIHIILNTERGNESHPTVVNKIRTLYRISQTARDHKDKTNYGLQAYLVWHDHVRGFLKRWVIQNG